MITRSYCLLFSAALLAGTQLASGAQTVADWKMKYASIMTPWASLVNPKAPLPEYPRPQMTRTDWLNLNGVWQFQPGAAEDAVPAGTPLRQSILVPYPMESALSGVMEHSDRSWYRREFTVPVAWAGKNVLLHFGAVDWESEVFVNGKSVGVHRGGYDPFTFDITPYLKKSGPQELIVRVFDETNRHRQAVGKQVVTPEGFWYTQVSGIWQTVWAEPVPKMSIDSLKLTPDVNGGRLKLTVAPAGSASGATITAVALDGGRVVGKATGAPGAELSIPIPNVKLWSPQRPFLYDLKVTLSRGGKPVDSVASYFGMRAVSIAPGADGFPQMLLNGKPFIQVGVLDQGWWPDGLYTAPTDDALKWDIAAEKNLGFNMVRKHIKVEPARWYYWADKLGILVWQDMPSRSEGVDASTNAQFETELGRMIATHENSPSIVTWIDFNEGWGDYDADRIANWVKSLDPTRFVTIDSGDFNSRAGDLNDIHNYPHPTYPFPTNKPRVLGEHGAGAFVVKGHTWLPTDEVNPLIANRADMTALYCEFADQTRSYVALNGLKASVYTQITDVERELNGFWTYDRKVCKVDIPTVRAANLAIASGGDWRYEQVVESSERFDYGQTWRSTTQAPVEGWSTLGFDDAAWRESKGAFGSYSDRAHTPWTDADIWIRKTFTLDGNMVDTPPHQMPAIALGQVSGLRLRFRYEGEAEFYLNGVLAYSGSGNSEMYRYHEIAPAALAALKADGKNVLAVHCKKTRDGQYIDAGLVFRRSTR